MLRRLIAIQQQLVPKGALDQRDGMFNRCCLCEFPAIYRFMKKAHAMMLL
jgi:hypothetical protein